MSRVDIDKWPVADPEPGSVQDHEHALRVLIDDIDCKIEQADGDRVQQDRLLDQRCEYMRELHAHV